MYPQKFKGCCICLCFSWKQYVCPLNQFLAHLNRDTMCCRQASQRSTDVYWSFSIPISPEYRLRLSNIETYNYLVELSNGFDVKLFPEHEHYMDSRLLVCVPSLTPPMFTVAKCCSFVLQKALMVVCKASIRFIHGNKSPHFLYSNLIFIEDPMINDSLMLQAMCSRKQMQCIPIFHFDLIFYDSWFGYHH